MINRLWYIDKSVVSVKIEWLEYFFDNKFIQEKLFNANIIAIYKIPPIYILQNNVGFFGFTGRVQAIFKSTLQI